MKTKKTLFILLIIISIGITIFCWADKRVEIYMSSQTIYADKDSSISLKADYKNRLKKVFCSYNKNLKLEILKGKKVIKIIPLSKNEFFLKSNGLTGEVILKISSQQKTWERKINCEANYEDYDKDGFPDSLKLSSQTDRNNFLDWFVSIAESQFYKISSKWYAIHRDCSGLINFAFKEALKKHDNKWLRKFPLLIQNNISDVEKYNYPKIPILGKNIFRIKPGRFQKSDPVNGSFATTANASNLLNFNLNFKTKDSGSFQKGDILFFLNDEHSNMPYHSMIYAGGQDPYLIYHTGPSKDKPLGEVRKVKLNILMQHPDKTWHPVADNPKFLGAYRWKILE